MNADAGTQGPTDVIPETPKRRPDFEYYSGFDNWDHREDFVTSPPSHAGDVTPVDGAVVCITIDDELMPDISDVLKLIHKDFEVRIIK